MGVAGALGLALGVAEMPGVAEAPPEVPVEAPGVALEPSVGAASLAGALAVGLALGPAVGPAVAGSATFLLTAAAVAPRAESRVYGHNRLTIGGVKYFNGARTHLGGGKFEVYLVTGDAGVGAKTVALTGSKSRT